MEQVPLYPSLSVSLSFIGNIVGNHQCGPVQPSFFQEWGHLLTWSLRLLEVICSTLSCTISLWIWDQFPSESSTGTVCMHLWIFLSYSGMLSHFITFCNLYVIFRGCGCLYKSNPGQMYQPSQSYPRWLDYTNISKGFMSTPITH